MANCLSTSSPIGDNLTRPRATSRVVQAPLSFFTSSEVTIVLQRAGKPLPRQDPPPERRHAVLRMKLPGARRSANWEGLEKQEGISNYFIGNDPAKWRSGVPNYGSVRAQSIYPGVDLLC